MARRLRIQYEGAIYHVINRGNYRRDIFATGGAAKAFEAALDETCARHQWKLHAHVIMSNHFHLALETPLPNLVEGMHWLQSTYATRFNRLRSEQGHLFQGRYQSPLVEDAAALVRVISYIHLNPVMAGIVPLAQLALFRWSSLPRLLKPVRLPWVMTDPLLSQFGLEDSRQGWASYVEYLKALAGDPVEQQRQEFDQLSLGWAIGSLAWRRALAKEYAHLALAVDLHKSEISEIKETKWLNALQSTLLALGKNPHDIAQDPKNASWKIQLAALLRRQVGAPHRWLAMKLNTGSPNALRVQIHRCR